MIDHPKFCPHCGVAVATPTQFCTSCGKQLVAPPQAVPTPTSAPPKSSKSGCILVIATVLLIGYWLIGGAASIKPRATPTTSYRVEYRIGGTTGRVDLTYANSDGATEQQGDARVPWNMNFSATPGQFVYVSAQNQQSSGTVVCEILLNGTVVKTATSSGGYTIATCSGRI